MKKEILMGLVLIALSATDVEAQRHHRRGYRTHNTFSFPKSRFRNNSMTFSFPKSRKRNKWKAYHTPRKRAYVEPGLFDFFFRRRH